MCQAQGQGCMIKDLQGQCGHRLEGETPEELEGLVAAVMKEQ